MRQPALLVLIPLLATGCSSTEEAGRDIPELRVELVDRPQSAYAALVRALEVMDAIRDPEAEIRLRALESDSIIDRQRGLEYVRVVFDLTVFSGHYSKSQEVFQELVNALDAEARASGRAEVVVRDRVDRVFRKMTWTPQYTPSGGIFRSLVSISDTIRIEVWPGDPAVAEARSDATAPTDSRPLGEYVRSIAAAPGIELGPLVTSSRVIQQGEHFSELRYEIRPYEDTAAFTRDQIGEFLFRLENESPGITITHVAVEPAEPGSDMDEGLWYFEASISVRLRAADAD